MIDEIEVDGVVAAPNVNLDRILDETVADATAASATEGQAQVKEATTAATAAQAEENKKLALKVLEGAALESVNMLAGLLNKRFPHVAIDGDERQRVAAAAAPVMFKHAGSEMPAWLLPYAEEFRLGMALAGVGFGVWMQAQAHAEAQENARLQAEYDRQHGITRQSPAPVRPAAVVDLSTGGPMAGVPASGAL